MFHAWSEIRKAVHGARVRSVVGVAAWQLQAQTPAPVTGTSGSIEQIVRPFAEKYCLKCHSGGAATGIIQLSPLLASRDTLTSRRREWETFAFVLQSGQMPPASEPRPPAADVAAVVAIIRRELATAARNQQRATSPPTSDWLTFGYDPERTGWARAETTLNRSNVGQLSLLWKTQLDAVPNNVNMYSTLT